MVSTFAGNGEAGLVNGSIENAKFSGPFGICKDKDGNLYVADAENHCIRKINPEGEVSTYVGGAEGYQDGIAAFARFNQPINICVDEEGNLYVSDFLNHRIRKVSTDGSVSTVAGSGEDGFLNGEGEVAKFNYPRGIVIDKDGNLYVADSWNHRIRKIDLATNEVTTHAGGGFFTGVGSAGDWKDGKGVAARFYTPSGLSVDEDGNLYVADPFNHRIRKIDTSRNVTTIVGDGAIGPNNGGFLDGTTMTAVLNTPTDVYWSASGHLIIGDTFNNRVRRLDFSSGMVSTVAGTGTAGYVDGADSIAELNYPRGIVANVTADSILVVDHNNHAIRQIVLNPISTTIEENLGSEPNIDFYLFPNPANNHINVQFAASMEGYVAEILNNQQQSVYKKVAIEGEELKINISHLPTGIYFFTLTKEGEIHNRQFIVE
ncbi:MAG: T9SS type A sorting domain-containing protein [Chitinophagales bacterium]